MKTVKDKVIELCSERNISIYKVEKDLGFGNGTIRKWESNIPNSNKLQKVADYFGVSSDYLLGRDDTPGTVTEDEIKFALFGGDSEITDEMYAEVKKFAEWVKNREKNK